MNSLTPSLGWPQRLAITGLAAVLVACGGNKNTDSGTPSSIQPVSSAAMTSSSLSSVASSSVVSNSVTTSSMLSQASSSSLAAGFEATLSDFVGYEDWALVDYAIGNSNPGGLGGAHQAANDAYSRKTLANALAKTSLMGTGEFAEGAMLIKETFSYSLADDEYHKAFAEMGGLLAMVKRKGGFNPDHGGWEWFMLKPDLSGVVAQGADLMGGACNACHSKASTQVGGRDYVFPKPTEYVADEALFAGYASWDLIEFTTEPHPKLGMAHQNSDSPPLRKIFQKQIWANPLEDGTTGYPIGTVLVKEVIRDAKVIELVAMVKRGGQFNPEGGNWEWFMLDPATQKILVQDNKPVRGAIAMCNGCHSVATDTAGIDFVFSHDFAPFNTRAEAEFIATQADWKNYTSWTVTDYATGSSQPNLGGAHMAGNADAARQVFENPLALSQTATNPYAQGSILVKEIFTAKDGVKNRQGIFAMVKRGGDFNPDHGGWEWVILNGQGQVQERGADLKNGACNACHSKGAVDYTFAKPSSSPLSLDAVANYPSWTVVDEVTGDSKANGGAHATSAIRRSYKKHAQITPYVEAKAYPSGTIFVKEIVSSGVVETVYGMLKAGGDQPYNGWRYFFINRNAQGQVTGTSAAPEAFCHSCHSAAGNPTKVAEDASFKGIDSIFHKKNDPVPLSM
jgi:hypothetical protein